MSVAYEGRGAFTNEEVNRLLAAAFEHDLFEDRWLEQVRRWSLGWVTTRDGADLVGFVNVPWDGLTHAFIIDVIVALHARLPGSVLVWSDVRRDRRGPPAVSGSTSTSRRTWRGSTWMPVGSGRRHPV